VQIFSKFRDLDHPTLFYSCSQHIVKQYSQYLSFIFSHQKAVRIFAHLFEVTGILSMLHIK